jgi:uncharacterized protein YdbL (DUF1318 family)
MSYDRKFITGMLVGCVLCIGMTCVLHFGLKSADAQGVGAAGANGYLVATTQNDQNCEILWLVDTNRRTMYAYECPRGRENGISLVGMRDIQPDMSLGGESKVETYSRNGRAEKPSPSEISDLLEAERNKRNGVKK